jgi:hypothetical protein
MDEESGKVTIFDFLTSIMEKKNYMFDDSTEKEYNPFMINRGLSQHLDTILYANDMNKCCGLSKRMQYDYFFYSIDAGSRRGKWAKGDTTDEDTLKLISKHYSISIEKARGYILVLSKEDINDIKKLYIMGGKQK